MAPFIAYSGIKWQRADIDVAPAGRSLSGELVRSRVATKIRLDVTCVPLTTEQASKVLTAIMPVWVQVTYTDPQLGTEVTKTMYSNNNPASYLMSKPNGKEYWSGIEFPLIEK